CGPTATGCATCGPGPSGWAARWWSRPVHGVAPSSSGASPSADRTGTAPTPLSLRVVRQAHVRHPSPVLDLVLRGDRLLDHRRGLHVRAVGARLALSHPSSPVWVTSSSLLACVLHP